MRRSVALAALSAPCLLLASCFPVAESGEAKSGRDLTLRGPVLIQAERCEAAAPYYAKTVRDAFTDVAGRGEAGSKLGSGKSAAPNADLVEAIKKTAPNARLERDKGATWKLPAQSAEGAELMIRLNRVSFAHEFLSKDVHKIHADLLHEAISQRLDELYSSETFEPSGAREGVRRGLACLHALEALEASALATRVAYQSGFSGDPKAIDAALDAVLAAQPSPAPVTEAELSAFWELAQAKALELDAATRKGLAEGRYSNEGQRLQQLGILKPHATLSVPHTPPSQVPTSGDAPRDAGERQEIAAALLALAHGDVVSILKSARLLLPKTSKLRAGVEGADAIARGDVDGALKAAHTLAPQDPTVAKVLAAADRAAMTAKAAGAAF